MKEYQMAITTQNRNTGKLSQEIVNIIANDYHEAMDKYHQITPESEAVVDVYIM